MERNTKTKIFLIVLVLVIFWMIARIISMQRTNSANESHVVQLEESTEISEELNNVGIQSASDIEIVFRDIPWGTSYLEVESQFPEWDLMKFEGDGFKTYSVDDVLIGDYEGLNFDYTDINVIASAVNGEIEVAGYITSSVDLYFSYGIGNDGTVLANDNCSKFYAAKYTYSPEDISFVYNDLKTKLTNLYGEPSDLKTDTEEYYVFDSDGSTSTVNINIEIAHWYGKNNTELAIRCSEPQNDTTGIYSNEIVIAYATRDGDGWLQTASDARAKEKLNNEHSAGNITNGL